MDIFAFRADKGIGADTIEDYDSEDEIKICQKRGTPPLTWTTAKIGSDYVITTRRSGEIIGTITVKGVTGGPPGVRKAISETGSCWAGGEYIWK